MYTILAFLSAIVFKKMFAVHSSAIECTVNNLPFMCKSHECHASDSMCISLSQNLLNTFNNMLLVGIGDTRTCTQLVDFCTACLAAGKVMK